MDNVASKNAGNSQYPDCYNVVAGARGKSDTAQQLPYPYRQNPMAGTGGQFDCALQSPYPKSISIPEYCDPYAEVFDAFNTSGQLKWPPEPPSKTLLERFESVKATQWNGTSISATTKPWLADESDLRNYCISASGEKTTVRKPAAARDANGTPTFKSATR